MGAVLRSVSDNSILFLPTSAVGGGAAGVAGETSGHVTVWAFNRLTLYCCCGQFRAPLCSEPRHFVVQNNLIGPHSKCFELQEFLTEPHPFSLLKMYFL